MFSTLLKLCCTQTNKGAFLSPLNRVMCLGLSESQLFKSLLSVSGSHMDNKIFISPIYSHYNA